jgi:hypothetical protein
MRAERSGQSCPTHSRYRRARRLHLRTKLRPPLYPETAEIPQATRPLDAFRTTLVLLSARLRRLTWR